MTHPHPAPPVVAFRGGERWGEVALHAVLALVAAGGTVLVLGLLGSNRALHAVAAYTAAAAVISLVWAIALAASPRLPGVERGGDGRVVVRAWPWPWWCDAALDAGLGCLGVALAVLGAGTPWAPYALAVGALGLWLLGRVGLIALGLRHREQLVLGPDTIEHRGPAGSARAPRAAVRSVDARGRTVVVRFDQDVELRPCPRPWRRTRARRALPDTIRLDTSLVGHDPADLARWIAEELGVSPGPGAPPPEGQQRRLRR